MTTQHGVLHHRRVRATVGQVCEAINTQMGVGMPQTVRALQQDGDFVSVVFIGPAAWGKAVDAALDPLMKASQKAFAEAQAQADSMYD